MKRFRPRLTYANVISSVALFIALGGAAVAAGLPRNSVGPRQLKRGAVTAHAIRAKAVRSGKIAPKAVVAGKLGPNAVLPGNLPPGVVSTPKLAAGAVNAEKIKNNVVTTNKLNNNAVTTQKLANGSVATQNLADGNVTTEKLGEQAVTAAKLAAGSVNSAKLADKSVTAAKLGNGAVGTTTLANGSVTAAKLAPETLGTVTPLASGQTERGVFDIGATNTSGGVETARGAISFQQALTATPIITVVRDGGPYPSLCPGLGVANTTPLALPGNLCIYLTGETNLSAAEPLGLDAFNRLGTGLVAKSTSAEGEFAASGVWAVTAP